MLITVSISKPKSYTFIWFTASCVAFLRLQARQLQLSMQVIDTVPDKPIVLMTWTGLEPDLPAILLNSHMDMTKIIKEWRHDPFSAYLDTNDQKIYARGAQDSKCVGIQYLEAVRRLKISGRLLNRTIYITFMPGKTRFFLICWRKFLVDAEVGGLEGMYRFVRTEQFGKLNIGYALDAGRPSPNYDIAVFTGEKCFWSKV